MLGFEAVLPPAFSLFRPPLLASRFDAPVFDRARDQGRKLRLGVGNLFVLHMRKRSVSIRPTWNLSGLRAQQLAGAGYPKMALQQDLMDARRAASDEPT